MSLDNIKEKRIEILRVIKKKNRGTPVTDPKMVSNIKNWMAGRSCPSWEQFVEYCQHFNVDIKSALLMCGYRPDDLSYEGFVGFLLNDFSRSSLEEILDLSASSISKILSNQVRLNMDKILLLMTKTSRPFSYAISKMIGSKFALRTDSLEVETKHKIVEEKMLTKPWVDILVDAAYQFSDANRQTAAQVFAQYFDLNKDDVLAEFDDLIAEEIVIKDDQGFYKPTIEKRNFTHFQELALEYIDYFLKMHMVALRKRRGNFGGTNTFACSEKTIVRIYQKFAEFENFALIEAAKDPNKEMVMHMDNFFWMMFKDFDKHQVDQNLAPSAAQIEQIKAAAATENQTEINQ